MLHDCPTPASDRAEHKAQWVKTTINGTAAFIAASLVVEGVFDLDPKDKASLDNFGIAVGLIAAVLRQRPDSFENMTGVPFEW
jgi:hypothetical protein